MILMMKILSRQNQPHLLHNDFLMKPLLANSYFNVEAFAFMVGFDGSSLRFSRN
jgi:hypothetical protein